MLSIFRRQKKAGAIKTEPVEVSAEELFPLRTDGIYCFIKNANSEEYISNKALRFYESGVFISVVVSQTEKSNSYFPKSKWFYYDNSQESSTDGGRWTRKGNSLKFSEECRGGSINYKGTICEDHLCLDVFSTITGNKQIGLKYEFYPYDKIPGWLD